MESRTSDFKRGVIAGIPIALGYLSVSFTFGILAVGLGMTWWQALIISMTNVTSAGQLAGVQFMMVPGQYVPMLVSQLTINARYSFMSISLAQKVSKSFRGMKRMLAGFTVTDEIFAVAMQEEELSFSFFEGLSVLPYLGWAFGTLAGALLGEVLPEKIMLALNMGLYAMFVAILVPEMRKSISVVIVVLLASLFSVLFRFVPVLYNTVPGGLAVSISAVIATVIVCIIKPVEDSHE